MKEREATREEAIEELKKQVESAWKDINEEFCFEIRKVGKLVVMPVANLTTVMDVLYKDSDGYTNSEGSTKDYIAALLLKPIIQQRNTLYVYYLRASLINFFVPLLYYS